MKRITLTFLISVLCIAVACVEPVEFIAGNNKEILIVDGVVSDKDEDQYISLRKAYVSSNTNVFRGITDASVMVIEDGTNELICREGESGRYYLPTGFRGKVGHSYVLKIRLPNGNEYESESETMRAVPDIDRIYAEYKPKGVSWRGAPVDGHHVYLDAFDFPDSEDYYSWSWKLSEKQEYCMTCEGGMYMPDAPYNGICLEYPHLKRAGVIYDYVCNSKCWEMYFSETYNIMSDIYSSGRKISGRKVAEIPFFQINGAVVEIYQASMTPSAFRFFKLMVDQTQNTGSLVETPPAPLVGNIKNKKDPFESIGGFFMVSSYKIKQFWLARNDTGNQPVTLVSMFYGRYVNPEPYDPDAKPPRPPLAPCVASATRTPVRPRGWVD